MNLIFITRIVDRNDSRSGFIFDWIDALSEECERLVVVCQEKGETEGLPANVVVHSFGKERGYGKLRQLIAFYKLLFTSIGKADGVFAHMHPVYAILVWPFAVLYGKKLGLWYTHKQVDVKLKIAHALVDMVFTASKESCRLPSKKKRVIGHGINMARFARSSYPERSDNMFRMVSIGRISPSKDYETMIMAIKELIHDGEIDTRLHVYGDPALKADEAYLLSLLTLVEKEELEEYIFFHPGVPYGEVAELYSRADLFINLSRTGSLDKSVLEAAASKILVLTSNEAFYQPLINISPMLVASNNEPIELSSKIKVLKELGQAERDTIISELREWVSREHDIKQLARKIVGEYSI